MVASVRRILRNLFLALWASVFVGSASALFLFLLDWSTQTREHFPWIVAGLPIVGFCVAWLYGKIGKSIEAGNNLLIDEIHEPKSTVPFRMAPMILFGTVVSHLFGASVGREGTAVQMGGAITDQFSHWFKLSADDRKLLLMAGISAGFASVFGTPFAGLVFALEVLAIGKLRYDAILPCLLAAVAADQTTLWWGIHHTQYSIPEFPAHHPAVFIAVAIAGICFGLVGKLFAFSTHTLSARMKTWIPNPLMRPVFGGAILAFLFLFLDAGRFMGLGIPVIQESFFQSLSIVDSAAKFIFTVFSIGSGFKGGEVTPLFYIGATFGNALAPILQLPFPFLAGLGFVAVFAGAANTPLACSIMAVEIFGGDITLYAAIACIFSYAVSGHQGIYKSQRIGAHKLPK
jgi:H+/Cl- antiporter ClcA